MVEKDCHIEVEALNSRNEKSKFIYSTIATGQGTFIDPDRVIGKWVSLKLDFDPSGQGWKVQSMSLLAPYSHLSFVKAIMRPSDKKLILCSSTQGLPPHQQKEGD